jgi:hypothetical protein
MRRLPGPAVDRLGDEGNFRGSLRFVSGLAENTNSIICDSSSELEAANGCPVLRGAGTISREAYVRRRMTRSDGTRALLSAPQRSHAFRLTKTYMDVGYPEAMMFFRLPPPSRLSATIRPPRPRRLQQLTARHRSE